MKATLSYDLDDLDKDDVFELKCAMSAKEYYFALSNIKEEIRSVLKYQDPPPAVENALIIIRDLIPGEIE